MAKRTGFVIKRVDDEHVEITLEGKEVVSLNHDEDGWDGIERAENLVKSIADILDIPVTEE